MQLFHGSELVVDASRVYAISVAQWPDCQHLIGEAAAIILWIDGCEQPRVLWQPPPFVVRPDRDPERAILCEAVGHMANEWADGKAHISAPEDMILAAYADTVRKQREEWAQAASERQSAEQAVAEPPMARPSCFRWPWRKG